MNSDDPVREMLGRQLGWEDAHVGFDRAIEGIPPEQRGVQPAGLPYSPWQLVEHLRLTQNDILEFCRSPEYQERNWPEDYWPASPEPESDAAWNECILAFQRDRESLQDLARDPALILVSRIPHGEGQTYLRELLLAADHSAYHIGQLVIVRRLLGCWPAP